MRNSNKRFSSWVKWENRNSFSGIMKPGVYLLAHSTNVPSGHPNPLSKKIVYIGETTRQTLKKRLDQFDKSAFSQKNLHSGGKTYRNTPRNKLLELGKHLLVAIGPYQIPKKEDLTESYIKYLERKLIWEYVDRRNKRPLCNKR